MREGADARRAKWEAGQVSLGGEGLFAGISDPVLRESYRDAARDLLDRNRHRLLQFALPIFFLQPVLFQLSFDTLTEPVFGAVLIFALRLLHQGKKTAGLIALSFLPLARPEGGLALIAAAIWSRKDWKKIPFLAIGPVTWWLAALVITGDPLHILHDWPSNWKIDGPYGCRVTSPIPPPG